MIQQNWDALIKPRKYDVVPGADKLRQATVTIEPLERGFGLTLGNALRRVLMSSLQGAAITGVHIDGVLHEFSSIPGVREDVTDIVLNLKDIFLKMEVEGPRRLTLKADKRGPVLARDIVTTNGITVLNKKHVICHLDKGASLRMELTVNTGKGFVSADQNKQEEASIGFIPVDAIFSPIRRVSYDVQPTREGQVLDYDKLTIKLVTDGSILPEDALALAARIIQEQLNPFVNFQEPQIVEVVDEEDEQEFNPKFLRKVEELELSVRSANCLKNDNIVYIGDLVQKSENDMMKTPNFGRKSLNEIKEVLAAMQLHLGMETKMWPPDNIEELAKKHEGGF